jgi:hypothetical protein
MLAGDLPGTGSETCGSGKSGEIEMAGFRAASRPIVGKPDSYALRAEARGETVESPYPSFDGSELSIKLPDSEGVSAIRASSQASALLRISIADAPRRGAQSVRGCIPTQSVRNDQWRS